MRREFLLSIAVLLGLARSASAAPSGTTPEPSSIFLGIDTRLSASSGRASYVFTIDPLMGTEGGVRTSLGLGRLLFGYEEALPKILELDEQQPLGKATAVLGRTLKLVFIDSPLAETNANAIHEIFGHGSRGREDGRESGIFLTLPWPYCGLLTGGTHDNCTPYASPNEPTTDQDRSMMVTLGGVDANYTAQWWLNAEIVQAGGRVTHGESLLYLLSKSTYSDTFLDPALQTQGKLPPNDDLNRYVGMLQDRFNRWRPADRASIAKNLQTAYLWSLADPTLIYASYSTVINSLWRGERESKMPLPSVGSTVFYPSPRFALSPFGAEHAIDVFVGRKSTVVDLYGRVVSGGLASAYGGGARLLGWQFSQRISVGAEVDAWSQPEVLPARRAVYRREQRFGWNAGASLDIGLAGRLGVTGRLAYKTAGFLMGQPLDEGIHGYIGLSIRR